MDFLKVVGPEMVLQPFAPAVMETSAMGGKVVQVHGKCILQMQKSQIQVNMPMPLAQDMTRLCL